MGNEPGDVTCTIEFKKSFIQPSDLALELFMGRG
jgi:hypothetical protein